MRPKFKTLLGLGDEQSQNMEHQPESGELAEGKRPKIQYLSDPQMVAAETGKKAKEEIGIYVNKLDAGEFQSTIKVNHSPLSMGVMSNSDFTDLEDDQAALLGLGGALHKEGHLKGSFLDVNSISGLSRAKVKQILAKAHQSGEVKDLRIKPGMLEDLKFDLDLEKRLITTTYSGNGPRCFMVRKNTITDISEVENFELHKDDILFVATKKVLDALVWQTTSAADTPQEYYNNELANQVFGIIKTSRDKNGKVDPNQVLEEITSAYQMQMTVNPAVEKIASSFLVYQVN